MTLSTTTNPSLPLEIFGEILQLSDNASILALRAASHAYRDFITPLAFRSLTFDSTEDGLRGLEELKTIPKLCSHVHALTIRQSETIDTAHPYNEDSALQTLVQNTFCGLLCCFPQLTFMTIEFSADYVEEECWDAEAEPSPTLQLEQGLLEALGGAGNGVEFRSLNLSLLNVTVWPLNLYELPSSGLKGFWGSQVSAFKMTVKSALYMEGAYSQDPETKFWETSFRDHILPAFNPSKITNLHLENDLTGISPEFPDISFPSLRELTFVGFSVSRMPNIGHDRSTLEVFLDRHASTLSKLALVNCSFIVEDGERNGGWAGLWKTLGSTMLSLTEVSYGTEDEDDRYIYCDVGFGYMSYDDVDAEWYEEDNAALDALQLQLHERRHV